MNITITTTIYNGYGEYVSDWLGSIIKQEVKPKEVVIALGRNHKMPKVLPRVIDGMRIKVVYCPDEISVGGLKNLATKEVETEWMIYIDVDDVLTPNAVAEMKRVSKDADAICLKYWRKYKGEKTLQGTIIPQEEHFLVPLESFRGASGYLAVKKIFKGEEMLCEDVEFPDFPFMFKAFSLGMRFVQTKEPCAVYNKRSSGHAKTRTVDERQIAYDIIEHFAKHYYGRRQIPTKIFSPPKEEGGIFDKPLREKFF